MSKSFTVETAVRYLLLGNHLVSLVIAGATRTAISPSLLGKLKDYFNGDKSDFGAGLKRPKASLRLRLSRNLTATYLDA